MTTGKSHINEENIRRYLENQMTDKERNIFERELQKHPFEAEAIEGFQQVSTADLNNDLKELKTKIIPVKHTPSYRIWAAAATFLLLVSVGVIWFQVKDKSPIPEMAETQTIEKQEKVTEQQTIKEPEIKGKEKVQPVQPELIAEKPAAKKSAPTIETTPNEEINTESEPIQNFEADDEMEIIISDAENSNNNTIIDNQARLNNVGIKNETITIDSKPTKNSMQPLNLRMNLPDSFEAVQMKKDLSETIQSKSSVIQLDEIQQDKTAQPKIGIEEYKIYLEKEAVFPVNYENKTNSVILTLIIDTDGIINELHNKNNADSTLFERSKEIILNGPDWNPKIKNGLPVSSEIQIRIVFRKQN